MSIELSAVAPAVTGAVKTGPNTASPAAADGVFRQIALAFAGQSEPALAPEDAETVLTVAEAPETAPEVDDEAVLEALLSSEESIQIKAHPSKGGAESQSTEVPVERAQHKANSGLPVPTAPAVVPADATAVQQDEPAPNGMKVVDSKEIRSLPEVQNNFAKQQPLTQRQQGTKTLHTTDIVRPSDEATASIPASIEKKAIGTEQAQTSRRAKAAPALMAAHASTSSVQRTALPISKTGEAGRSKENATPPLEPLTPTIAEVKKQTQPAQIQAMVSKSQSSVALQDIATPEKLTDRFMPETAVQTPLSDTPRMVVSTAAHGAGISPMAQPDMRQIASSLTNLVHAKADATTEIQLSPEELGRVRLVISTQESGTTVMVSAERPETADYLRRNLDLLEKTCRDMGLDSADISYAESDRNDERADQQSNAQQSASPDNSTSGVTPQKTAILSINLDRLDLRL